MKESPGGEAGASPKEKARPEALWTPRYYPKARDAQSKGLRCAAIVLTMGIMLRMRALPAGFIAPCLPTKTDKLPSGDLWLHEIKHDGFRVIARKGWRPRAALQPPRQ